VPLFTCLEKVIALMG